MTIRHRIQMPHGPNCLAVREVVSGHWDTPWSWLDGVTQRRKNGANIGPHEIGERWWWARCNDPDCPGEIVISENDILAALEGGNDE